MTRWRVAIVAFVVSMLNFGVFIVMGCTRDYGSGFLPGLTRSPARSNSFIVQVGIERAIRNFSGPLTLCVLVYVVPNRPNDWINIIPSGT